MHDLPFQDFQTLIAEIDKSALFDAVKPELQRYARRILGDNSSFIDIGEAYHELFRIIEISCTGITLDIDIDVERDIVGRMGKGSEGKGKNYSAGRIHAEKAMYFFLFSKACKSHIYAERICTKLFKKDFYDAFEKEMRRRGIPRPRHLPPANIVDLDPLQISLGFDVNLTHLEIDEEEPEPLFPDEQPNVFAALTWRSRLTGLYGRKDELKLIEDWALDKTKKLKVMLVSGPGGAGKTRLGADAVARLVHDHDWCGGFLGDPRHPIDGAASGIALIIDYPEERTQFVCKVLKAASKSLRKGNIYQRPVRLILLSRESTETWGKLLNERTDFITEISLEARPYLDFEHAFAIAEDVAITYPEYLGRAACNFTNVDDWLNRDPVHRLPLNVLAAAVHAVLDPEHAFKLDGSQVLGALAEWELRRVRYYSMRNLGEQDTLEKLLGLSLLTRIGLTKDTVYQLGDLDICPGKRGTALLDTVRKTPYWKPKTEFQPSHLIRIEPDPLAAIFGLKALELNDPSPAFTDWLAPVASQEANGFCKRLTRLSFDIGQYDPTASANIEKICIQMLDMKPELTDDFIGIFNEYPAAFIGDLTVYICRSLIRRAKDEASKAALLRNMATMLGAMGRLEDGLSAIAEAVEIYRSLAVTSSGKFKSVLANSLDTQAHILSDLLNNKKAFDSSEEAVSIFRELAAQSDTPSSDLADSLDSHAIILAQMGQRKAALLAILEACKIYSNLVVISRDKFLPDLARVMGNQSSRLAAIGSWEDAIKVNKQAVLLYRELSDERPDIFLDKLAMCQANHASTLSDLGQHEAALEAIEQAIVVYRKIAAARPDAFRPDLAGSLAVKGHVLSGLWRWEPALEINAEVVEIQRGLIAERPDALSPDLAMSLNNMANSLFRVERYAEALETIEEAVRMRRALAAEQPEAFLPNLAMSLNNKANILDSLAQPNAALESVPELIIERCVGRGS